MKIKISAEIRHKSKTYKLSASSSGESPSADPSDSEESSDELSATADRLKSALLESIEVLQSGLCQDDCKELHNQGLLDRGFPLDDVGSEISLANV